VTRTRGRDGGATMAAVLQEIRDSISELDGIDDPRIATIQKSLNSALAEMESSTASMLQAMADDVSIALGVSFDYLMQTGYLFGGWQLARSALVAYRRQQDGSDNVF